MPTWLLIPLVIGVCILCFWQGKLKGRSETMTKIFSAIQKQDRLFSLGKFNDAIATWERHQARQKRTGSNRIQRIVNNFRK